MDPCPSGAFLFLRRLETCMARPKKGLVATRTVRLTEEESEYLSQLATHIGASVNTIIRGMVIKMMIASESPVPATMDEWMLCIEAHQIGLLTEDEVAALPFGLYTGPRAAVG